MIHHRLHSMSSPPHSKTPFPTMAVGEGWADRFPALDLPFRCPYLCMSESIMNIKVVTQHTLVHAVPNTPPSS